MAQAAQCGNGAVFIAHYLQQSQSSLSELWIAGRRIVLNDQGWVSLGPIDAPKSYMFSGKTVWIGSVGNLHAVLACDDDPALWATKIRPHFPSINVSTYTPDGKDVWHARVDENGVGKTLACGSAACAAFSWLMPDTKQAKLHFEGEHLSLNRQKGHVWLHGPVHVSHQALVSLDGVTRNLIVHQPQGRDHHFKKMTDVCEHIHILTRQ